MSPEVPLRGLGHPRRRAQLDRSGRILLRSWDDPRAAQLRCGPVCALMGKESPARILVWRDPRAASFDTTSMSSVGGNAFRGLQIRDCDHFFTATTSVSIKRLHGPSAGSSRHNQR
jgi:hypothetical protein